MFLSKLLTTEEVAGMLRVNVQSIRRWAISGKLPSIKRGKCYLFEEQSILTFLQLTNAPDKHTTSSIE
jgi:excisionase family DNA binding protein